MNLKQIRKAFKNDLEEVFGKGNVSVKSGTGTASSWTDVNIITNDPEAREKALKVENKYDFPTYWVDDGYGDTYSTCVLIQIEHTGNPL